MYVNQHLQVVGLVVGCVDCRLVGWNTPKENLTPLGKIVLVSDMIKRLLAHLLLNGAA